MVCINRISELAKQINKDYLILLDMGLSYLGRALLKNALVTLVFIDSIFYLVKEKKYTNRAPKGAMEV